MIVCSCWEEKLQDLRSAVVINPVDLSSNEHTDLAVLPPLLIGQQVRDQQGQTWTSERHQTAAQQLYTVFCDFKMKDETSAVSLVGKI